MVPRLKAPIVFIHGLLGYGRVKVYGTTLVSYFANIPDLLSAAGNRVFVASVHPVGSVAERAAQLRTFLNRYSPDEPVHLFAHSMGGLDSRYMISRLGMASQVLTLTTLGTPHRGTAFADWAIHRFERLVKPVAELIGLPLQAVYDLTTQKCKLFSEEAPDAAGVRYFSVAGRHEGGWQSPEWQLPYSVVLKAEGPNDGIVSVASATHGESTEIWPGDHISLINWLNPVALRRGLCQERSSHYAALVRRLADEGY